MRWRTCPSISHSRNRLSLLLVVHLSNRAPLVTRLSRSPVATENRRFPLQHLQIGQICLSFHGDPNTCQSIPSATVGAAVLPSRTFSGTVRSTLPGIIGRFNSSAKTSGCQSSNSKEHPSIQCRRYLYRKGGRECCEPLRARTGPRTRQFGVPTAGVANRPKPAS